MTELARADALIMRDKGAVEKQMKNYSQLFHNDVLLNIYAPDDPHLLLKDFKPVVTEPYPQQIYNIEPSGFPRYEQKHGSDSGYNNWL